MWGPSIKNSASGLSDARCPKDVMHIRTAHFDLFPWPHLHQPCILQLLLLLLFRQPHHSPISAPKRGQVREQVLDQAARQRCDGQLAPSEECDQGLQV